MVAHTYDCTQLHFIYGTQPSYVWPVCGQHSLSSGSMDSHCTLILTDLPFSSIQSMFHINIFQPLICLSSETQTVFHSYWVQKKTMRKVTKAYLARMSKHTRTCFKKNCFLLPEEKLLWCLYCQQSNFSSTVTVELCWDIDLINKIS